MVLLKEVEMLEHDVREEGAKAEIRPTVCRGVSSEFSAEG